MDYDYVSFFIVVYSDVVRYSSFGNVKKTLLTHIYMQMSSLGED